MGLFEVSIELGGANGHTETLDALVDTGASFTMVPAPVLQRLGVQPDERARFSLADGRIIEREVGTVVIRLDGKRKPTPCIFGEEGEGALLGAVTLEQFLLAADPVNKTLVPVIGRLARGS